MKVYKFTVTLSENHMKQLKETHETGDMYSCEKASYDIMNNLLDMQDSCDFVEEECE